MSGHGSVESAGSRSGIESAGSPSSTESTGSRSSTESAGSRSSTDGRRSTDGRGAASDLGAILLAGGRASRMGGAPKPLLEIHGRSLLRRAVDAAAAAGCHPITIVADRVEGFDSGATGATGVTSSPGVTALTGATSATSINDATRANDATSVTRVRWVREDPPFGGPTAATVAALASWESERGLEPAPEWTLLLACDLPRVDAAVPRLVEAIMLLPSDTDGVCFADASGRPQWLTGLYRTSALRAAASALPDRGRDAPVRALLDDLSIAVIRGEHGEADDVDTWEDLKRARGEAAAPPQEQR